VSVTLLSPSLLAEVDVLHLMFGGHGAVLVVAYVLTATFVMSLFVIFYKLVHVSQAQSQSISFLDKFWESKRLDDIFRVAEGLKHSPLSAMFRAGYIELSKVKKGQTPAETGAMHEKMDGIENIERALTRARVSETTKLENLLPFLATVGSAAPFVGLFGTVWGIMDAFTKIAEAGKADLATVSGPIAEALIATAISLAAAIPSVVAYNYFNRRIKVLGAEMTTFGSDYLNIVKRHFF